VGAALLAEKRFAESEHELLEAYATLVASRGAGNERAVVTASRLARLYGETGKAAEEKRYRDLSVPPPPQR